MRSGVMVKRRKKGGGKGGKKGEKKTIKGRGIEPEQKITNTQTNIKVNKPTSPPFRAAQIPTRMTKVKTKKKQK